MHNFLGKFMKVSQNQLATISNYDQTENELIDKWL